MSHLKLLSPDRMLSSDNYLHITNDVNQAMVEFGFIVKGNFLKWMVYGDDLSEEKTDPQFSRICASLARHGQLDAALHSELLQKVDKYLYDLPARRRIALAFILFNSESYANYVVEMNEQDNLSNQELKLVVGRQIEQEIYVGGSYDMERRIREMLVNDIRHFASEFSFISGGIKKERVLELLDIYSRSSIAALDFD